MGSDSKKKAGLVILISGLSILCLSIIFLVRFDIPFDELKKKYANNSSQFIEIDGVAVHYRDEGTGFPLVLIHGTAASLHTWDGWVKELGAEYRTIRFDLPAFGLTGPNTDHNYSIKWYTSFLSVLLDTLVIKNCYLAGNSLGGWIAWEFAAQHPQRVSKLILIDAAGYTFDHKMPLVFRLAQVPLLNSIFKYVTPRAFIAMNLREVYGDDQKITASVIDRYYELALRSGNREAFIARAKTQHQDRTDLIGTITIPTLIMWGREDVWIPWSHATRFQKALLNSELIMYEGVGHIPMEEIPVKTAQDARTFLQ
ncbi:alpha/beta fold hydrolase [candidate division CSSED10-310 bacterium]|uniref:Alpha/beta fold hydrolase n=1 Tax=candidate division CSSED10-310 bacterium TaxID=2855610 RepID=A0ABV6YVH1_UNCC1